MGLNHSHKFDWVKFFNSYTKSFKITHSSHLDVTLLDNRFFIYYINGNNNCNYALNKSYVVIL